MDISDDDHFKQFIVKFQGFKMTRWMNLSIWNCNLGIVNDDNDLWHSVTAQLWYEPHHPTPQFLPLNYDKEIWQIHSLLIYKEYSSSWMMHCDLDLWHDGTGSKCITLPSSCYFTISYENLMINYKVTRQT